MRPLSLFVLLSVVMLMIALLVRDRADEGAERSAQAFSDRGLGGLPSAVQTRDAGLDEMLHQELGGTPTPPPEINFDQPREKDLHFLWRLVREGAPPQRLSSARALIEIGDVRSIPVLLNAQAQHRDEDLCAAAQEMLRLRTREEAALVLARALGDGGPQLTPACRAELEARVSSVVVADPGLVESLLEEGDAAAVGWVVARLPSSADPRVVVAVQALAGSPVVGVQQAARRWLAQGGPVPEAGAATPSHD